VAVPTWNYVAVHAYGRPRIVDDPSAVQRVLRQTVDTYESGFERPWSMDGLPAAYVEKMAANVVAFEIEITRLEGKRKLSQNRSRADRVGATAGLRHHGGPDGIAVAELMEEAP
jgi:transcriptional regulator